MYNINQASELIQRSLNILRNFLNDAEKYRFWV